MALSRPGPSCPDSDRCCVCGVPHPEGTGPIRRSLPLRPESRLRFASLPAPWRLEDFDFDAQPAVDRQLVSELVTLRFLDEAAKVLLIGPPRAGKTMLAVCLARLAAEAGHRVYCTTAADLAARLPPLRPGKALGHHHALLRRSPPAGDRRELWLLPLVAERDLALFQVITQRYLKGSIYLTSKRSVASWGQMFQDPILDRLRRRSTVLQTDGASYRMAGLPGPGRGAAPGGRAVTPGSRGRGSFFPGVHGPPTGTVSGSWPSSAPNTLFSRVAEALQRPRPRLQSPCRLRRSGGQFR